MSCSWNTQALKRTTSVFGEVAWLVCSRIDLFLAMNIFVFNEPPHDRTENPLGGSGPNVCIDFTRLSPCVLCNPPRVRTGNKWGETDSAYCSVHKGLQHPHAHTCVLCPKQRATLNTVCTLLWHTIQQFSTTHFQRRFQIFQCSDNYSFTCLLTWVSFRSF